MTNIKHSKKVMKNSNGFFTLFVEDRRCICISERNKIDYHKKGISIDNSEYIPYSIIRKVVKEYLIKLSLGEYKITTDETRTKLSRQLDSLVLTFKQENYVHNNRRKTFLE